MNKTAFITAFLLPFALQAQHFNWQAKIDPAQKDGHAKVLLSPGITSQLRSGFPDIRVYDKENYETPYLVYKDEAKQGLDRFITYQVVETHYSRGCCSFIKVKNSTGKPIDHIVLEVNNADARREMNLAGSYDGVNWFVVRDEFVVETFNGMVKGEKKTTSLIRFDFPLTDYKYYKFEFDDWYYWWRDYHHPVFIVRAGHVEPTFIPEKCLDLPKPAFVQKDSGRQTLVDIRFDEAQYTDHFKFNLRQVKNKDYYRSASLYELVENDNKTTTEKYIGSTVLSSMNDNEISLPGNRAGHFVLKINNEDDRPLIVDDLRALQVKHYLVADLEKNNVYTLRFGNDSIPAPVYDMQYFKNKIQDSLDVLQALPRENIAAQKQEVKIKADSKSESKTFFTSKTIVWFAIGGVGLLLLFLTARMLKDMKRKDEM